MSPQVVMCAIAAMGGSRILYNPMAADVWAAGVALYGLACRQLPFNVKHIAGRPEEALFGMAAQHAQWVSRPRPGPAHAQ